MSAGLSLGRLWAVARKEALHVLRDPRSLLMALGLPVLLLFLFGYALTLDVDRVPLAVWDQSGTPESRELTARFTGSRYFARVDTREGYEGIEAALDRREILAALVIPHDFAKITAGRPADVQFLLDGSDSNTASIALGYAEAVTEGFSREVLLHSLARSRGAAAEPFLRPPYALDTRVWFNPGLESKNHIVPGLIAIIIMVIAALLTSLTVAREWENGTIETLLASPLKPLELLAGKFLPYFALGMFDVLLAAFLAVTLFDVPFRGSFALFVLLSALFVAGALSMGLLISSSAKNQLVANQLAFATTFLPAFLLSGFVYAVRNMPAPVELISRVVPARYFIAGLRGIFLKGVGFSVVASEVFFLAAFFVLTVAVAARKLGRRLP